MIPSALCPALPAPVLRLCFAVALLVLVAASGVHAAHEPPAAQDNMPLFGLATGLGSVEDEAYNNMLYNGMVLARAKFGIRYIVKTPQRVEDDLAVMESLVRAGCGVVIAGGGYHMIEPMDALARKHPHVTFLLMDDVAKEYLPNVASVTFRQNEGSFLAGALAALMSHGHSIAFLGAADLPVINDFLVGYKAGAKHVRPDINIDPAYVSNSLHQGEKPQDANPFDAPEISKTIALDLYDKGNEIIFSAAAGSNRGVFEAAREKQRFAIGVDSDQDHMAKGFILTSMLKRVDEAILHMVETILAGNLQNRNFSLGLEDDCVGLSPMTYTRMLIPPAVFTQLEQLRSAIETGEIAVPTAMPEAQRP